MDKSLLPPFKDDEVLPEIKARFQEQLKIKLKKIALIKKIQHERRSYTEEEYLILNEKELLLWPEQISIMLAAQAEKKCKKRIHYQPLLIKDDKDFFDVKNFFIDKIKKGEEFFYYFIFMDYFPPGVINESYDQKIIDRFNRESIEARRKPELEDGGMRQWHCIPLSIAFNKEKGISLFSIESAVYSEDLTEPVSFQNACMVTTIGHVKRLALDMEQVLDKRVNIYFGYCKIQLDQQSCPIFAMEFLKIMYREKYSLCNQLPRCHLGEIRGNFPNRVILLLQENSVGFVRHPRFLKNSQNSYYNAQVKEQNFIEYLKQYSVLKPEKKRPTGTESRNCAIDFKAAQYIQEALDFIENTRDSLENIIDRQMGRNVSILDNSPAFVNIVQKSSCFSDGNLSGLKPLGSKDSTDATVNEKLMSGIVENRL